jgi:hypothetical protein
LMFYFAARSNTFAQFKIFYAVHYPLVPIIPASLMAAEQFTGFPCFNMHR